MTCTLSLHSLPPAIIFVCPKLCIGTRLVIPPIVSSIYSALCFSVAAERPNLHALLGLSLSKISCPLNHLVFLSQVIMNFCQFHFLQHLIHYFLPTSSFSAKCSVPWELAPPEPGFRQLQGRPRRSTARQTVGISGAPQTAGDWKDRQLASGTFSCKFLGPATGWESRLDSYSRGIWVSSQAIRCREQGRNTTAGTGRQGRAWSWRIRLEPWYEVKAGPAAELTGCYTVEWQVLSPGQMSSHHQITRVARQNDQYEF